MWRNPVYGGGVVLRVCQVDEARTSQRCQIWIVGVLGFLRGGGGYIGVEFVLVVWLFVRLRLRRIKEIYIYRSCCLRPLGIRCVCPMFM